MRDNNIIDDITKITNAKVFCLGDLMLDKYVIGSSQRISPEGPIPILDIKNGLLIKGINLEGLRVLGDPFNFANFYYNSGADEICYVDNVATLYGTNNLSKFISRLYQHELDHLNGILMIEDKDRIKDGFIAEQIPKELFHQLLDRLSR